MTAKIYQRCTSIVVDDKSRILVVEGVRLHLSFSSRTFHYSAALMWFWTGPFSLRDMIHGLAAALTTFQSSCSSLCIRGHVTSELPPRIQWLPLTFVPTHSTIFSNYCILLSPAKDSAGQKCEELQQMIHHASQRWPEASKWRQPGLGSLQAEPEAAGVVVSGAGVSHCEPAWRVPVPPSATDRKSVV